MNAKVTYYEEFSGDTELPTIEDCAEWVANDMGLNYSTVLSELCRVDVDNFGKVDENMFLALYYNADEGREPQNFKCDSSICTSVCDRCRHLRLSREFLCSTSGTLKSHCFRCRGDSPLCAQPKNVFSRVDIDVLDGKRLAVLHMMNLESAAAVGKGIDCCYIQRGAEPTMDRTLSEVPLRLKDAANRDAIESRIRDILLKTEGYRYTRTKTGVSSSRFLCTQRSDSARIGIRHENERKRRRRDTVKRERCGGVLTIRFAKGSCTAVTCFHEYIHESIPQIFQITPEVNERIKRGAQLGLSPFQIASDLNKEETQQFTWSQVYYRWCLEMEKLYKTSPDIEVSARNYLRSSQSFEEIYHRERPFALGFLCTRARNLCEELNIREAFIDSTFKTNSSKLELFAVLGSFLGTGFPIAYLLLQGGSSHSEADSSMQRKDTIRAFLQAIWTELPRFRPIFFFTDKDVGQIYAISSVFQIAPSICLWHMKRAVKRKLAELQSTGVEESTNSQRNRILDLMSEHFNIHPFLSTSPETMESLYLKNLQKISDYCGNKICRMPTLISSEIGTPGTPIFFGAGSTRRRLPLPKPQ